MGTYTSSDVKDEEHRVNSKSRAGLTVLAMVAALGGTGAPADASGRSGPMADVVVRAGSAPDVARVEAAVRASGGTVGRPLALISGFAARVPSGAVPALRATPGVVEVTADETVRMKADKWIDDGGPLVGLDVVKKAAGGK